MRCSNGAERHRKFPTFGVAIRDSAATQPPIGENSRSSAYVDVTPHSDSRQTAVFQEAFRRVVGPENYFVTLR
jgi:hypothetical protein